MFLNERLNVNVRRHITGSYELLGWCCIARVNQLPATLMLEYETVRILSVADAHRVYLKSTSNADYLFVIALKTVTAGLYFNIRKA